MFKGGNTSSHIDLTSHYTFVHNGPQFGQHAWGTCDLPLVFALYVKQEKKNLIRKNWEKTNPSKGHWICAKIKFGHPDWCMAIMCFQVSGSCMDYVSPGGRINNVCSSTCLCLGTGDWSSRYCYEIGRMVPLSILHCFKCRAIWAYRFLSVSACTVATVTWSSPHSCLRAKMRDCWTCMQESCRRPSCWGLTRNRNTLNHGLRARSTRHPPS